MGLLDSLLQENNAASWSCSVSSTKDGSSTLVSSTTCSCITQHSHDSSSRCSCSHGSSAPAAWTLQTDGRHCRWSCCGKCCGSRGGTSHDWRNEWRRWWTASSTTTILSTTTTGTTGSVCLGDQEFHPVCPA